MLITRRCSQLECLQNYGFCKSHSYSYAYLVYALAYLKYYYPREFWKATINHCQSSYRSWVHYREAAVHLELTHMKRPYKLVGNRLLPLSGGIQPRLFIKNSSDLHTLGYWVGHDFLEGMTFLQQQQPSENEQPVSAYFRGIVATYRPYYDRSPQSKCRKITFITVGYDCGKYLDIVANGHYPLSKCSIVSGHGILENGNYIHCKKIILEN